MASKLITVFEHQTLQVDGAQFQQAQFNALVKFNDKHGGKYFKIGYNKVTFGAYVGVIQVGTRTLQILPKADLQSPLAPATQQKWQKGLLSMLKKAGYLKINATELALQSQNAHHLMDIYLYNFLAQVKKIIQAGLVKKYCQQSGNFPVLKGRLLTAKQIQFNLVHKERFYTEQSCYDSDHRLNQVLKKAIEIVRQSTSNATLKSEFDRLHLDFEHIGNWNGTITQLDNMVLSRKSAHYAEGLELAKLIIKNFSPDFSAGGSHVLALMFNMNALFERFVLGCFKEAVPAFKDYNLSVSSKSQRTFWNNKTIIPDILLSYQKDGQQHKIIIDSKWKIIPEEKPSDEDIRQIYAYNLQFGATRAVLLYPKTNQRNLGMTRYEPLAHQPQFEHSCALHFADIFIEQHISGQFVQILLNDLLGISA